MKAELLIGVALAAMLVAVLDGPSDALAEEAGAIADSPAALRARAEILEHEVVTLRAERDLLRRENARLVKAEKDRLAAEQDAETARPAGKTSVPSATTGDGATVRELWVRISGMEKVIRQLQAERDLLKRENARLVKAEKDRLAPEPVAKPDDKPAGKTPGKTYFVPDRDEAWWTDLDAFARDVRRRIALKEDDPDQAVPAWLARLGDLAGTKIEWKVRAKDFSIQSILPDSCLGRAKALAEFDARPAFMRRPAFEKDGDEAEAIYSAALQAAWTAASKAHGARWVQAQVGPCAVSMILPVDALLERGGRDGVKIVGRIVAVRGHEAGLEMFVEGTVSILPILPVAK